MNYATIYKDVITKMHPFNIFSTLKGPLPETFGDFWRMVWEQRSATIVMMTKLEERSRVSQYTLVLYIGKIEFARNSYHKVLDL